MTGKARKRADAQVLKARINDTKVSSSSENGKILALSLTIKPQLPFFCFHFIVYFVS